MTLDDAAYLPLRDSVDVTPWMPVAGAARFETGAARGFAPSLGEALTIQLVDGERESFAWSVWVHVPDAATSELGTLLSSFDHERRSGAELSWADAHSTTSRVNANSLQFGVDWGASPRWEAVGRPPHSAGILALAVHDGELYTGTLGDDGLGRVFVHRGTWEELVGATSANCVSALASHDGALHIGTTRYRTGGSALDLPANDEPGGEILRWSGGWQSLGRLPGVDAISALTVQGGRLHAAAMYQEGIWRLESHGWQSCGSPGRRVLTLGVHAGRLHAGGNDHADPDGAIELTRVGVVVEQRHHDGGGGVFALDAGSAWESLGYQPDTTQIYSLTTSRDMLHASTWPNGLVYALEDGGWRSTGRLGDETEVMGLITYNGSLYGGTLPHAQLHRRDAEGWTRVGTLDVTPDALYRRAAGLAIHDGSLVVGTLPSGSVHRMRAGDSVTYDHSVAPGWHHVVVSADTHSVDLWIDGDHRTRARSAGARRSILDGGRLVVGSGSHSRFAGTMRNLRIFERSVSDHEVRELRTTDDPRLEP